MALAMGFRPVPRLSLADAITRIHGDTVMITRLEWLTMKAALHPLCPPEAREVKALAREVGVKANNAYREGVA